MISILYLYELSTNQSIHSVIDLRKKVSKANDPARKTKLLKAQNRAEEKASMKAWESSPSIFKAEQKSRDANRLRRAVYTPTTRPDLEADVARKLRMAKKKVPSYIGKTKRIAKELMKPVPTFVTPLANIPRV